MLGPLIKKIAALERLKEPAHLKVKLCKNQAWKSSLTALKIKHLKIKSIPATQPRVSFGRAVCVANLMIILVVRINCLLPRCVAQSSRPIERRALWERKKSERRAKKKGSSLNHSSNSVDWIQWMCVESQIAAGCARSGEEGQPWAHLCGIRTLQELGNTQTFVVKKNEPFFSSLFIGLTWIWNSWIWSSWSPVNKRVVGAVKTI